MSPCAAICTEERFGRRVAMPDTYPCSPKTEINGIPYFARMCQKIRLHGVGELHPDLQQNLGRAMDAWTCQFFGVDYDVLKQTVLAGKTDQEALVWAQETGMQRPDHERDWWCSFMRNVGFQDALAVRLRERIEESGLSDRDDILTMFDYIDADEGR